MPAFAITAIDRLGRRQSLREAASDEPALRERLRAGGLFPVRIRPVETQRHLARIKLPIAEFVGVLHQLELQLRAGVNADAALAQMRTLSETLAEGAKAEPAADRTRYLMPASSEWRWLRV